MNAIRAPISLSFSSGGAGWAEARMLIGEENFVFPISYLCGGINELLDCVYYLYPCWGHDDYNSEVMEYGEADIPGIFDGKETLMHWTQIPWKTSLMWNGEFDFVCWSFERPINIDKEFDVAITLEVHQEKKGTYNYTIRYKDLCYAVSKAVTDFIVEYGILGGFESAWMKDINLRHLLKIKEIALDESITVTFGAGDDHKVISSIEEEIKLLVKPM